MGIMVSPELLRRSPFFSSMEDAWLTQLAILGSVVEVEPGQSLFHEGDPAEALYLIVEGGVELRLAHGRANIGGVVVADLGRGDILGWSSVVEPHRYSVSAVARRRSRLIRFEAAGLCQAMAHQPAMGYLLMSRIVRIIGDRLAQLRVEIVSLIEGDRWQDFSGRKSHYVSEGGRSAPKD